ncbi:MAG: AIM24 family protein [Pseudomonadota bacterium]|nr:AIM24 family protein [Pseudomonadota bacterium]
MRFNQQSLPSDDNLNRFAFCTDVKGDMVIRRGKMIACYGQLRFEALGSSVLDLGVRRSFNAPAYVNDFMGVTGQGKLILGDNGNDIAAYLVEDATFTLKADHVLGFQTSLKCQESTLPGYVTLIGSGRLIASSNGPVVFMEPPCRVDEDAILGWADLPSPSYRYDYAYVQGILGAVGAMAGMTRSGEERQLDFIGKGTVLVQSSEEGLAGRSGLASVIAQISGLHQNELAQLSQAIAGRMTRR